MTNLNETEKKNISYSLVQNEKGNVDLGKKAAKVGFRHLHCLLLFLLVLIGFGLRVILSIAIVAMTDPKASINPDVPTYNWTEKHVILSSFFWGYIIPQVYAGYAANRFGAKWFLICSMIIQSVLNILLPFIAAYFGSTGLLVTRAIQGFCQGFLFPSVAQLLSRWVPKEERARLTSFTVGAAPFGTVIAISLTGYICASSYGWPLVFYLYGVFGFIWCILFAIFAHNSPAEHPTIGEDEKFYIQNSLGHAEKKPSHKVPFKGILTSVPLLALFCAQCGNNYAFWILLTQIPIYMNYVMNFNIKDNGVLSALPYLTLWVLTFFSSFISDKIVNKKLLSVGASRKTFNFIGLGGQAIALVALGLTTADKPTQAVVLLILAVGLNSAAMCGWALNHMDLSPNHAGTLMGLTNGFGNIPALLAPLSVQFIVTDERNPAEWRKVFFLAAGINVAVTIIFTMFGSGKVQPWNSDPEEESSDKQKKSNLS